MVKGDGRGTSEAWGRENLAGGTELSPLLAQRALSPLSYPAERWGLESQTPWGHGEECGVLWQLRGDHQQ